MSSNIFDKCSFAFELGSLPLREKNRIKMLIDNNGGQIHHVLTQQTMCLVCTEANEKDNSFKFRTARKFQVAVITSAYLLDCVKKQRCIDRVVLKLDGKIEGGNSEAQLLKDLENRLSVALQTGVQNIAFVAASGLTADTIAALHKPFSLPQITKRFYKQAKLIDDVAHPSEVTLPLSFHKEAPKSAAQIRHEKEKEYQLKFVEQGLNTLNAEKQFWKEKKEKERRLRELSLQKTLEDQHIKQIEEQRNRDHQEAILQLKKEKEERESAEVDAILARLRALASDKQAPALIGSKWLALQSTTLLAKKKLVAEAKELYGEILFPNSQTFVSLSGDPDLDSQKSNDSNDDGKGLAVSRPSFCDVVRKSLGLPVSTAMSEEKEEIKPIISFAGFKIFYGGIKFKDIEAMATNELTPWPTTKIENIKDERKALFLATYCEKFGNIVEVQEHWDEGYIFVVFDNKADCKNALETLCDFKTRKALAKEARVQLIAEGKEKLITPDPSFYVRWPNFYKRILKQKKDKKNKKPPKLYSQTQQAKQKKTTL